MYIAEHCENGNCKGLPQCIRAYDKKQLCTKCLIESDDFDSKGKLNDKRRKDLR